MKSISSSNIGSWIIRQNGAGDIDFMVYDTDSRDDTQSVDYNLVDGQWNLVTITFDSGSVNYYKDGNFLSDDTFSVTTINDSDENLKIGTYNDAGGYAVKASFDDVMIFNRSLSVEEIKALYANQSTKYLSRNFTSLSDANHSFKAYVQDLSGNINSTETRYVTTDTTLPRVGLDSPSNNTWESSSTITFRYTAIDTNLLNCSLYANFSGTWQQNVSNTSITSGYQYNMSLEIADGTYVWNMLCFDRVGNSAFNATNYTLNIATDVPTITQNDPGNSSWHNTINMLFNYTATSATLDSCSFYENTDGAWKPNSTHSTITS
jgi:hypothetical protein